MRIQASVATLLFCLCGFAMPAVSASDAQPANVPVKFYDRLAGCWSIPVTDMKTAPVVRIKIRLNRDGSLNGRPETLNPSSDTALRNYEKSAERALLKCDPFPELAAYAEGGWQELVINFDPGKMLGEGNIDPEDPAKTEALAKARLVGADEIKALPGVTFRALPPKGFCRVDPSRDSYDDAYFKAVSELLRPHNTLLAFWLECSFLEASRAGKDVDGPKRWFGFLTKNALGGGPEPETRSRSQMMTDYAASYRKLGIKNSPIQLTLDSLDARLAKEFDLQLERQSQLVIGPDELAIYLAGLTNKTQADGKQSKTATVSGITLIQSYGVSINASQEDADASAIPVMLDEVKKMLFAIDQLSTAD